MSFLNLSGKDKQGNIKVRFGYLSGLPSPFTQPDVIDVTIDTAQNKLIFKSSMHKNRIATLDLNKIMDVRFCRKKHPVLTIQGMARGAFWGSIIGPVGTIVGAVDGMEQKWVKAEKKSVIITYNLMPEIIDNRKMDYKVGKEISLEIVGASYGWKDFVSALPKDSNSPYAPKPKNNNKPIEL